MYLSLTMHWTQYLLPPIFCSLAAWFTVWIIIKFLFYPIKPFSILGFTMQGFIPKNKNIIALKIGDIFSREFINADLLKAKIANPDGFKKIKLEIENHIDHFLRNKLKEVFPLLANFIGEKTIIQFKSAFLLEIEALFPVLINSYLSKLESEFDVKKLITDKISSISVESIETQFNDLAKANLTKLKWMSITIGFSIGLIQVVFNLLLLP